MHIRAVRSQVVVVPEAIVSVTPSGIIIPDSAKRDAPLLADVVAVGPDVTQVKVGDKVLMQTFEGHTVELDNKNFIVLPERHIMGVVDVPKSKDNRVARRGAT